MNETWLLIKEIPGLIRALVLHPGRLWSALKHWPTYINCVYLFLCTIYSGNDLWPGGGNEGVFTLEAKEKASRMKKFYAVFMWERWYNPAGETAGGLKNED